MPQKNEKDRQREREAVWDIWLKNGNKIIQENEFMSCMHKKDGNETIDSEGERRRQREDR